MMVGAEDGETVGADDVGASVGDIVEGNVVLFVEIDVGVGVGHAIEIGSDVGGAVGVVVVIKVCGAVGNAVGAPE
jgi:hypothetical protein